MELYTACLLLDFAVEPADGYAERNSARAMLETALPGSRRITLTADQGLQHPRVRRRLPRAQGHPHIACNEGRAGGSALDRRTAPHAGYAISQKVRKRVEGILGWIKTIGSLRKTRYRASIALNCMPIWWRPPITCSESRAWPRVPHETRTRKRSS